MKLVIATRLHLGKASTPPENDKLLDMLQNFYQMVSNIANSNNDDDNNNNNTNNNIIVNAVIAVDATPNPKMGDYNYIEAIRNNLNKLLLTAKQKEEEEKNEIKIHILPVTPWGKFVPALNALVLYANNTIEADLIMFVSAEVNASVKTIHTLCQHVLNNNNNNNDTLVAGAYLNGHQHAAVTNTIGGVSDKQSSSSESSTTTTPSQQQQQQQQKVVQQEVQLNGRTCPWNTLAIWNVKKLSLLGFNLCSELGTFAGVEECATIACYQKLFPSSSKAKLIMINDNTNTDNWNENFNNDPERLKWHEIKMKSKLERAQKQLDLLNLTGTVLHIVI